MIRGIIFDCFGVLITDALQALCDEHAVNPEAVDEVKRLIRAVNKGTVHPDDARPLIAEQFGLNEAAYALRLRTEEVKNRELLDYILTLRKCYKTALLSNIGTGSLRKRFTTAEQAMFFDAVVVSGEIGWAKPEQEAYKFAARQLGLNCAECVFIDDREIFCDAARLTGMRAVHYRSFTQCKDELEKLLASQS